MRKDFRNVAIPRVMLAKLRVVAQRQDPMKRETQLLRDIVAEWLTRYEDRHGEIETEPVRAGTGRDEIEIEAVDAVSG